MDPATSRANAQQRHNGQQAGYQYGDQQSRGYPNPRTASQGGTAVPTALKLVALTFAGLGCVLVYGGLVLISGASELAAYGGPASSSLTVVGLLLAGFGVGQIGAAYGLWTLTPWGRQVGLYLAAGSLLWSVIVLTAGGSAGPLGLILYGWMTWYLYTNEGMYERLRQQKPNR